MLSSSHTCNFSPNLEETEGHILIITIFMSITIYWVLTVNWAPAQTHCFTLPQVICTAVPVRWYFYHPHLADGETEGVSSKITCTRQLSYWAAELRRHSLCHCLCSGLAARSAVTLVFKASETTNGVSADLCLGSPTQPGLCRHFEGLCLPSWLRTLLVSPLPSPWSRWFNYLKLFWSKDREVNSLPTPHLTNKMEIELPHFLKAAYCDETILLKNLSSSKSFQGFLH